MATILGTLAGVLLGSLLTLGVRRRLQQYEEAERLTATRREVYGDFLDAAHEMFLAIRQVHLDRIASGEAVAPEEFARRIDAISPHRGQICLERLRLVATGRTETRATHVWDRLRRGNARKDPTLESKGLDTWVSGYWVAEKTFLAAAREDMGLDPLGDGDRD